MSDSLRGNQTVMLMIAGLTYDRSYFNSSHYPYMYSWVYTATARGYSTFNIDKLGVGQSSRPPADQLTVPNHAYTVEQIIRKLRAGTIGGHAFTTVVAIGHSLGAGILQYLAGTETDATGVPDYLVFSGWLHQGKASAIAVLASSLHEASEDSVLSSSGYPSGYLTTIPGTREQTFFYSAGAASEMITQDETTKQTGTVAERTTLAAERASNVTASITVPVLLSVGAEDVLMCDEDGGLTCATGSGIVTREASYYGAQACLDAFSVPEAGHSVNLHTKAQDSYNYVNQWVDDYTINMTSSKDSNGCIP